MKHKLALVALMLIVAVTASSQRRPTPSDTATGKPVAARLLVQGTYEENYQGTTSNGNAQGKLLIKFEAARWLQMGTNEVGNAEFSELENAPPPYLSGSASYNGRVKSSSSGAESYEATSSFAGPLAGQDIVLGIPEYTDTANNFKLKILINAKLKGTCSLVVVRNGETGTGNGCDNGTFFITASSPVQVDDNDDPAKTPQTASLAGFGIELDIEPEPVPADSSGTSSVDEAARARRQLEKMTGQGPAGDAGVYAWRGAETSGSKEAGFRILLNKTKELPGEDKRSKSVRILNFTATIVPGIPK
jgi:hypothetical protein